MKSSHVKIIVVGVSACVLIGMTVFSPSSPSSDYVGLPLTSSESEPAPERKPAPAHKSAPELAPPVADSQELDAKPFKITPLPPLPSASSRLGSVPDSIELDPTQDNLRTALPIEDKPNSSVTADPSEPIQNEVPSLQDSTSDAWQTAFWSPAKDQTDSSVDSFSIHSGTEFTGPLDSPDVLHDQDGFQPLLDEDSSILVESEDSESSLIEDQDTVERQAASSPFQAVTEATDTLLEQIRNERVIQAQHEIRWSLNDAIIAALAYSNRVSSLRIESVEELQNVGVQSGQFDVVGFAEQSFRDSTEPVGSTIDTASGVQPIIQEQDFNLAYGLRRQLRSGGEFELNQSFQTRDNDSGILVPRDQAFSRFNARLTKELLRGAGRSIAMNEVLVAYHNASAQRAESVSEIAVHLNEVMTAYWDIFAARGALFASMENRQLAIEVLEELKARQDIDAEPNLLDQAEATIRQRELQINEANNNLVRAQIRLVSLINAPELLENLDTIEILPQVELDLEHRGIDVHSRINTAVQRRPEVADIIEQIKSAQVTNHVSLNDLLPRLSLSLETSLNGLEGARRLGVAFENQFDNDLTYQVGVNLEIPFANRQARYNRRRTELVVERLKNDWQTIIEQVKADVLDHAQEFSASQVRLEKQREILQFSGSELTYLGLRKNVAPKETSNPSFELTQLLAALDRQGTAKADFVAAIADKHRAIFELNQATGILINADVIPTTGGPARPGFFSVYHQYIEERAKFSDPAAALESQTRLEAKLGHHSDVQQPVQPPVHDVEYLAPVQEPPRHPLHQDYR